MGVSRSASRVCEWCLHNQYSYAVQAGREWERSWRLPCGRRWFIYRRSAEGSLHDKQEEEEVTIEEEEEEVVEGLRRRKD